MSIQNIGVHNKDGSLQQPKKYDDGRTKQSYKDETNIVKIMARAERAGTISHLQKFEGLYGDFSDFDFHLQTNKLTRGREIFDELPAELRKEFGQSPAAFFAYVNDPVNKEDLLKKLPALAKPGTQLLSTTPETADEQAALAAASELASDQPNTTPVEKTETPSAEPPAA